MAAMLEKTPLWQWHRDAGAKMVPFAGYDMPVQYPDGVLKEHLHTRARAGLFDVSHMGQAWLTAANGSDPALSLEKIVPGDIRNLAPGKIRYTILLNENGGAVDDLMVTRIDEKTLFLVVNAACKDKDYAYIRKSLPDIHLSPIEDRALLALQGPLAENALKQLCPGASQLGFMSFAPLAIDGNKCFVSRSGYTGEDGFEISIPAGQATDIALRLANNPDVRPAGLGARDSLRLEAGLCLYGHELDDTTSPVEANLKWTIAKHRREKGGFAGSARIIDELKNGPKRLRVGLRPCDRAPVREPAELCDETGKKVGFVTSGGFGPSLNAPVAMGYVTVASAKTGTRLFATVRDTPRAVEVANLPFIPANYKKD